MRDARLHEKEQSKGGRADDQQDDDQRMSVTDCSAFDQGEDDRAESDEGQDLAGPVEGNVVLG